MNGMHMYIHAWTKSISIADWAGSKSHGCDLCMQSKSRPLNRNVLAELNLRITDVT